jgi:hypothetical protein
MKNVNEASALPARFTPKAADLLSKTTSKEESARKQAQAAYDQMISDGMLWTDFLPVKAEGSTATPELREALLAARRKGFGAWAPKLYKTPNTALSKEDIAKKNKLRTDVNKKITDDRKAMRLRQDPEFKARESEKNKATRAPQQPTGQAKAAGSAAKVLESLQQAAKRAQAIEQPDFDVVELVALLAKAQQITTGQGWPFNWSNKL